MILTSIIFLILLIIGLPIAFVLGISSLFYFIQNAPRFLPLLPQRFYAGIDSFVLLAIPFFMFAGELMNASDITPRLVKLANVLVGRARGSLAHVNVVASIFFAGITGAAVSDVAALGSIFIPAMKKDGYSGAYSAAITACSSIIGPTIPPSTIILVYGSLTGTSIAAMFAGALVPGLLLGFSQMIVIKLMGKKKNFPISVKKYSMKEGVLSLYRGLPALAMPAIILFGILSGIFTPTEAAVVASGYAILFSLIVRTFSLAGLYGALKKAVQSSAVILLIIGCANIFGWILASTKTAQVLASNIIGLTDNPIWILLLLAVFLLFIGTWMETLAAITLLAPFLSIVAKNAGLDPVHFGIVVIVALNIGLITPPVGVCLFTASSMSGETFESIVKEAAPYIFSSIIILIVILLVPQFVLWIPSALNLL